MSVVREMVGQRDRQVDVKRVVVIGSMADEGQEQTRAFLNRVFYFYLMVAFPVVAGLLVIGQPLVSFVASEKDAAGAVVLPWVKPPPIREEKESGISSLETGIFV